MQCVSRLSREALPSSVDVSLQWVGASLHQNEKGFCSLLTSSGHQICDLKINPNIHLSFPFPGQLFFRGLWSE